MSKSHLRFSEILSYANSNLKLMYTPTGKVGEMTSLRCLDNIDDLRISIGYEFSDHWWMFRPLVRPLTDLIKDIEIHGNRIVPIIHLMHETMDLKLKNFSIHNGKVLADGFPVLDLNDMKLNVNQWDFLKKLNFWIYDQKCFEDEVVINLTEWENANRLQKVSA